jgi:hypothetical protein
MSWRADVPRSLPDFGDEVELPWPRAGDELFAPADDGWLNAHFGAFRGESYTIGYKAAGDILVEHVAQHEIEADTLVFPIVFCYRQYLELLLKDVLADARRYYDVDDPAPKGHSLLVLWKPLRLLLARRWPDDPSDLDAVEDGLRQFDAVDRGSYAFRYATTPGGESSLPPEFKQINLRDVGEVIERIGVFLESCATALTEELHAADY